MSEFTKHPLASLVLQNKEFWSSLRKNLDGSFKNNLKITAPMGSHGRNLAPLLRREMCDRCLLTTANAANIDTETKFVPENGYAYTVLLPSVFDITMHQTHSPVSIPNSFAKPGQKISPGQEFLFPTTYCAADKIVNLISYGSRFQDAEKIEWLMLGRLFSDTGSWLEDAIDILKHLDDKSSATSVVEPSPIIPIKPSITVRTVTVKKAV
jgi:hypothetical protein